jgi:hypothetical protein
MKDKDSSETQKIYGKSEPIEMLQRACSTRLTIGTR